MSPQNRQSDPRPRRSARPSGSAAQRSTRIARSAETGRTSSQRPRTAQNARPAQGARPAQSTRAARSSTPAVTQKRGLPLPLLILGIAILCVALFFGAFSCTFSILGLGGLPSGNQGGGTLDINDPAYHYESPYDWRNLQRTGDRAVYLDKNGKKASLLGIDVSEHQGSIDWSSVASDGIEFAYIRIGCRGYTEGSIIDDANYETNLMGAKRAGLKVGVYFFSQATTEAEAAEEAKYVLDKLNGEKLDLPIAFDHETVNSNGARANEVDSDTLVACANAFNKAIEGAGYRTMLYGNYSDLGRFGGEMLVNSNIWFAEYNAPSPAVNFDIAIWQYANNGKVNGISNSADMNLLMDMSILN